MFFLTINDYFSLGHRPVVLPKLFVLRVFTRKYNYFRVKTKNTGVYLYISHNKKYTYTQNVHNYWDNYCIYAL